uniref:Cas1p 10 TM acyl transferase domain-containing protein n=1 Tax=Meleagris gallopavo TaxID=9103 RepID=G3UQI9_MELGA
MAKYLSCGLFMYPFFILSNSDPVNEDMLSESRKMITNEKINAYNEAAVRILNSSSRNSKAKVKVFSVSKLIAQETIMKSSDGLHLPESSRDTNAMILMNVYCNKIMKPIDGSCCQPQPPLTLIQKLAFCFFTLSIVGYFVISLIHRNNYRKNKSCTDLEIGEEKKPTISTPNVSTLEMLLHCFCKLGLIMTYFYLCDRANLFMKENKFYTHSSFFIPIVYILVLGVFYTENTKETKVLNREQTDEWKGWMQLVILIYHISGASTVIFACVHAHSSSGGCISVPNRLWALLIFLDKRGLRCVQSVSGKDRFTYCFYKELIFQEVEYLQHIHTP